MKCIMLTIRIGSQTTATLAHPFSGITIPVTAEFETWVSGSRSTTNLVSELDHEVKMEQLQGSAFYITQRWIIAGLGNLLVGSTWQASKRQAVWRYCTLEPVYEICKTIESADWLLIKNTKLFGLSCFWASLCVPESANQRSKLLNLLSPMLNLVATWCMPIWHTRHASGYRSPSSRRCQ